MLDERYREQNGIRCEQYHSPAAFIGKPNKEFLATNTPYDVINESRTKDQGGWA